MCVGVGGIPVSKLLSLSCLPGDTVTKVQEEWGKRRTESAGGQGNWGEGQLEGEEKRGKSLGNLWQWK